jgi:hypothetical protein
LHVDCHGPSSSSSSSILCAQQSQAVVDAFQQQP